MYDKTHLLDQFDTPHEKGSGEWGAFADRNPQERRQEPSARQSWGKRRLPGDGFNIVILNRLYG